MGRSGRRHPELRAGGHGGSFNLGSSNPTGTEEWVGLFADVALYSAALSSNVVTAHYNAFASNFPPIIQSQPQGGTVFVGAPFSLSVAAEGAELAYQWSKNNTPITGATNAILSFASLTTNNAGTYQVKISNPAASVTSSNAVVTVFLVNPNDPVQVQDYQTAVRAESSLISYYTFDGGTAADSVNTNNGTLTEQQNFCPASAAGRTWHSRSTAPAG